MSHIVFDIDAIRILALPLWDIERGQGSLAVLEGALGRLDVLRERLAYGECMGVLSSVDTGAARTSTV